jgi:hypothetical protein
MDPMVFTGLCVVPIAAAAAVDPTTQAPPPSCFAAVLAAACLAFHFGMALVALGFVRGRDHQQP